MRRLQPGLASLPMSLRQSGCDRLRLRTKRISLSLLTRRSSRFAEPLSVTAKHQTGMLDPTVQPRRASRRWRQIPYRQTLSADLASSQDGLAAITYRVFRTFRIDGFF
ncbi:hypothetical protein XI05_09510 [Bradyrhizobium sp. CCBAU 11357]|nr:hypothetical protein [Bradyrhizobium sp. CCBAU 11357]